MLQYRALIDLCTFICMCMLLFPWQFHKAFHSCVSFLSSFDTSLHHSSQTPPLLVSQLFWLTCSSLLPSTVSFMPVVLCALFLSHVSIFRVAQWCTVSICCLLLPQQLRLPMSFILRMWELTEWLESQARWMWMHQEVLMIHSQICFLDIFTKKGICLTRGLFLTNRMDKKIQ